MTPPSCLGQIGAERFYADEVIFNDYVPLASSLFQTHTMMCCTRLEKCSAALNWVLMIYPKAIFNQAQTQGYLVFMASEDTSIPYKRADKSPCRQGKPIMGPAPPLRQPGLAFSLHTASNCRLSCRRCGLALSVLKTGLEDTCAYSYPKVPFLLNKDCGFSI